MGKRTRYWPFALLIGVAVCLAGVIGWWAAMRTVDSNTAGAVASSEEESFAERRVVHLYFSDGQGRFLKAESQTIAAPQDQVAFARTIVEGLIAGPKKAGIRTLPEACQIRAIFIQDDGTACVDFEANAFDNFPGGVKTEQLAIYSVVNSLILNSDTIEAVQLLSSGQEGITLAGHMDISRPLAANMLLIR